MAANMKNKLQLKLELEREEVMLKSMRAKLLDQLQRLKVEELALVNDISKMKKKTPASSTGSYFNTTKELPAQEGPQTTSMDTSEASKSNEEVNNMPLLDLSRSLASTSLIVDNDIEEEEDD